MYPGYPNQQPPPPFGGFATPNSGYPQQGYPQPGGYQAPPPGGYPPQPGAYPPQPAGPYPPPSGYPQQNPGYPGYPPSQPGGPGSIGFGDPMPPQSGYPGYPGVPPAPHYDGYPGGAPPPSQPYSGYPGSAAPSHPPFGQPGQYPPPGPPPGGNYPPPNPQGGFAQPYNAPPGQPHTDHQGYLPPHIANNPHFQPGQPQSSNLYPNLLPTGGQPPFVQPGAHTNPPPSISPAPLVFNPTLRPHQPFNPSDDAAKLYKAMKGFGTDETTLIDILCKRTSAQRQEIILAFKSGYGKDLVKNIESETSGNLKLLFKSLLYTPSQLEAHDLQKSIQNVGTDEAALVDILCTKTNREMQELKNNYKIMYHKDLEKDVGGDVSGYFKRLLVSLSAAYRSDAPPDPVKAANQARELYSAGAGRLGTDEMIFNRIFASESFPHLRLVCDEYYKQSGQDIEKAIKSEMSGDVERAFLAIVDMARNPSGYFAKRLKETMASAGTYDRSLIRNIVLRSEKDLMDVKGEFQRRFGKSLESWIKSDCSGDYKRGLLCLAGDPHWR